MKVAKIGYFDALAFNCIFPQTIPQGFEDKGYSVSAMLYPVLNVLMMPLAAWLMDQIGVANILFLQSGMSILAAITENGIEIDEVHQKDQAMSGFRLWYQDFKDGLRYLKGEKGLLNIYAYDAATNGASMGYGPLLVAFFRTTPGFSAQAYAFFLVAEFVGRTIGGAVRYRSNMKPEKRRLFVYFVQQFYNVMDAVLLWMPYPAMLVNRSICGFLGINSATVRSGSIHRYLPEEYRARVNAFADAVICAAGSVAALLIGALGEVVGYRMAMTITSLCCILICWRTVGSNKEDLEMIYLYQSAQD